MIERLLLGRTDRPRAHYQETACRIFRARADILITHHAKGNCRFDRKKERLAKSWGGHLCRRYI